MVFMPASAKVPKKITAIIVTYGKRWSFLRKVIQCLESEDLIAEIVVVDNASHYDVKAVCLPELFQKTIIIKHISNIGSAGGFASGIDLAITREADFIFLLDDDNLPLPGTLAQLLRTYLTISLHSSGPIVVVAYRKCQYDSFWRTPRKLFCHRDNFMGFNIFNALQRHLFNRRQCNIKKSGPEFFRVMRRCPFSGMLLSAQSLQMIGLPLKDMVIYYDDVEWMIRILDSGGTVWLDTEAIIEEQNSNYAVSVFNKPIIGMIFADSETKIYYLIRNRTYLDVYIEKKSGFAYILNKFTFLSLLLIGSLLFGKFKRFITVLTAYIDGSKGKLGMNSRYELS